MLIIVPDIFLYNLFGIQCRLRLKLTTHQCYIRICIIRFKKLILKNNFTLIIITIL